MINYINVVLIFLFFLYFSNSTFFYSTKCMNFYFLLKQLLTDESMLTGTLNQQKLNPYSITPHIKIIKLFK